MTYPVFEIAAHFNLDGTIKRIEPFGNGHINDTFRIIRGKQNFLIIFYNEKTTWFLKIFRE